jgi:hypothetical protein
LPAQGLNPTPSLTARRLRLHRNASSNLSEVKEEVSESDSIEGVEGLELNSPAGRGRRADDNESEDSQNYHPSNGDGKPDAPDAAAASQPVIHDDDDGINPGYGIDTKLRDIHFLILEIKREEGSVTEHCDLYVNLLKALINLNRQADIIANELGVERQAKAAQIRSLVERLCNKMEVFLRNTNLMRIASARTFGNDIQAELDRSKTRFLDKRAKYDIPLINLFFSTDSRAYANKVKAVGEQISNLAFKT